MPECNGASNDNENYAVVDKTKTETSINWEIGVRSTYFREISFESTLFHTQVDDIVIYNGNGAFINGGESEQNVIEFGGRVGFSMIYNTEHNIYLQGSYTNVFVVEFNEDGLNARFGVNDVSCQQPDTFAPVLSAVDTDLSGLAGDIPAYTLLNMSVNFKPVVSKANYFMSGYKLSRQRILSKS